ncbi:16313_t:CDS:2 [Gigaspora rosea]|nr:16313_t:CDS:2 [Gigaspora rosea]
MDSSNEFDPSDNEEKNSSDDEVLASTSTSTSNLRSFVWQFFKKYNAVILIPDNQEEEVEKVRYSFDSCATEYVWLGSTSNQINHLRDIYHITKESLANTSVKVH